MSTEIRHPGGVTCAYYRLDFKPDEGVTVYTRIDTDQQWARARRNADGIVRVDQDGSRHHITDEQGMPVWR